MPSAGNFTIDLGVDKTGVQTRIHQQGDDVVVQHSFDAEPHLQYAQALREAQDGQRWGEGKLVGHIPPEHYARISMIADREERKKAVKRFFQENPAFLGYTPYLK